MPRKFDWGRVFAGAGKGLTEGLPRGIEYGIEARTRAQTTREKAQKAAQDVVDLLRKREEEYYKTIGYEPRIPEKPAMPGYTPTFIPRLQGKLAIGGIPGAGRVIPPQELIMPGPGPMQKTPMVPSRYPTFEEYQAGEHIWAPKSPKAETEEDIAKKYDWIYNHLITIQKYTPEAAAKEAYEKVTRLERQEPGTPVSIQRAEGMMESYIGKPFFPIFDLEGRFQYDENGKIGMKTVKTRDDIIDAIKSSGITPQWYPEVWNRLMKKVNLRYLEKETPGQKDFGKKYGY